MGANYVIKVDLDEIAFRVAMVKTRSNIARIEKGTGICKQTIHNWINNGQAPLDGAVLVSYFLGLSLAETFGPQKNLDSIVEFDKMLDTVLA